MDEPLAAPALRTELLECRLAAEDMEAAVLRCSRAAVSLLRGFDYVLDTPPGSAGALAELELRAEREWVGQRNASPAAWSAARQ